MKEEEIPDLNIFMMCEAPESGAFSEMPEGFSVRNRRRDEKAFPFGITASSGNNLTLAGPSQ